MTKDQLVELQDLFVSFQTEVQKHAVQIGPSSILFSNLISISQQVDQVGLFQYMTDVRHVVERTSAYKELEKLFDDYYRNCQRSVRPDIEQPISDELAELITEEDFTGYEPVDSSTMGNWLYSSGFYRSVILKDDKSCWRKRFGDFLRSLPNSFDVYFCYLALDGFISDSINLGESTIIGPDDTRCEVLSRLIDYELADPGLYKYHAPETNRLGWKTFSYLFRKVECQPRSFNTRFPRIEARESIRTVFDAEHRAMQLTCNWQIRFPNAFVIPMNAAERLDFSLSIKQQDSSWWAWWELVGEGSPLEAQSDFTLKKDQTAAFECLVNSIAILEPELREKMGTSIELYMAACATHDESIAFLLFVFALESLLIGEFEKGLTKKFRDRLSRLLVPQPKPRQTMKDIANLLYLARCDMVHGRDPSILADSRKLYDGIGISSEYLRNIVRRSLLIVMLCFKVLGDEKCKLRQHLKGRFPKKSSNSNLSDSQELMMTMNDSVSDENIWIEFYSSVESAYCTSCGNHDRPPLFEN